MKNGLGVRRRLALDIFSSIEDKRIAAHELRTIMWEATLRCNLACRHCGSDCRSEAAVPDMPAADFLRTASTVSPKLITAYGGTNAATNARSAPSGCSPVSRTSSTMP